MAKKNKQRSIYKLHIVTELKWVDDPEIKPYPDNHPMYRLNSSDLKRTYKNTANSYFWAIPFWKSATTMIKHRNILLEEFGFDISEPLPEELKLKRVNLHYVERTSKTTQLKIV